MFLNENKNRNKTNRNNIKKHRERFIKIKDINYCIGGILKGVNELIASEEEATKLYNDYLEATKTREEKYLEDLKKVYYNLKNGKKVIDVFSAMEKAGTNEDGNPRLAISRAGFSKVYFEKKAKGSGSFGNVFEWNGVNDGINARVDVPSGTFSDWEMDITTQKWPTIVNKMSETKVPLVPAHLLPKGKLENYFILWEAKEWKALPPTKDPYLLKRISTNLFVVLAEWDVTAIEQAVIRGSTVE